MKDCCTDSEGNPKKKYSSKQEAEKIAQLRKDEGAGMNVYQCEERDGWHLTSPNASPPAGPQDVITSEDRWLYTMKIRKRLENVLGEAKSKKINDEIRRNALQKLEAEVNQLERDVGERVATLVACINEFVILRGNLKAAEQDLHETRRNLSRAMHELEVCRRGT